MSVENQKYLQLNGKMHSSPTYTQNASSECPDSIQSQCPNLFRGESLITFRWESMNALDILSVLDSAFPAKSASSTLTSENGYGLYDDDDDLWMQPELILSKEVEKSVAAPICEDANVMNATASKDVFSDNINQSGQECASLFISGQGEGVLADCNWDTVSDLDEIGQTASLSSFGEMVDDAMSMSTVPSSLPSLLDCTMQKASALQPSNSSFGSETRDSTVVIANREVSSIKQCSSADTSCQMTTSQHSCSQPDIKPQLQLPLPASDTSESFDGGKHLYESRHKFECQSALMSTESKPANSARFLPPVKVNQAQARARRVAANQRRADGRAKKHLPYKLIHKFSPSTAGRSDRVECFSSERSAVHFPLAQQPLQSVPMAPGAQFQSTVSSSTAVNGNEYPMVNESSEMGQLEQLKNSVRELDEQTRLCIRDSLYRLARSAKERQNEAESRVMNKFMPKTIPSRISREGALEAETNPIDRWMVNLLFCKQPNVPNISSQSYAPFSTGATSQVMIQSTVINQNSQLWNSCGILPDIRLCTY